MSGGARRSGWGGRSSQGQGPTPLTQFCLPLQILLEGAGHSYRNDNLTPLAMVRHPAKDKRSSVSQYSIEGALETKQSAYCWIPGPSSLCQEKAITGLTFSLQVPRPCLSLLLVLAHRHAPRHDLGAGPIRQLRRGLPRCQPGENSRPAPRAQRTDWRGTLAPLRCLAEPKEKGSLRTPPCTPQNSLPYLEPGGET